MIGVFETYGANHFEGLVQKVRSLSGRRIDWHYAAGRAIVKCLAPDVAVLEGFVSSIIEPAIQLCRLKQRLLENRRYSITLTDAEFQKISDRNQHLEMTLSLNPGQTASLIIQRIGD